MTDKLKPCPFCGGEAVFNTVGRNGEFNVKIRCMDCNISTEEVKLNNISDFALFPILTFWNTRHEQKLKEQLEEVFKRS